MPVLDNIRATAKARAARVVFPEMDEPRVARAATWLRHEGLAEPVASGDPTPDLTRARMDALVAARGMKEPVARRMLGKPLFRAAAMVAAGEADVMVAGADTPTRRVIEAAGIAVGLAEGVAAPSSFFLMLFPDGREIVFADCAVTVAPDAAGLADIAQQTVRSTLALLGDARPALLSFSTGTSGVGDSVDIVRTAARATGFPGPIQADAALNASIAVRKGSGAGDANCLIFPSLDAGNIAYKLCQELAGAQAVGPILQGFAKPVCDLSRGASTDDIIASTLATIALGG